MAKIIIQSIGFQHTPSAPQTVDITYRLTSDPDVPGSYTTVSSNLSVPVNGEISPDIEISGLTVGTTYTIGITNKCSGTTYYKNVLVDAPVTYVWVEDVFICEQNAVITKISDYSSFSSPAQLYFNPNNSKMYIIDTDDVSGNIQWFDPTAFTGRTDVTFYAGIKKTIYDGAIDIDPIRNKIYVAGADTGGLIVFDMTTNAIAGTVAYGADVAFGRVLVTLQNNKVYCSYKNGGTNTMYIINPDTLVVDNTIDVSTIPSGTSYLVDSYHLTAVAGNIWSTPTAGRPAGGVAIYNPTFTTLVSTIALPGSVTIPGWGSSKFFSSSFFDSAKNRFYVSDLGSSTLYVIDTTSNTIVKTITFNNREGKGYAQLNFQLDKNTNNLFLGYSGINSSSDASPIKRTYLFNRDTLEIIKLVPDLFLGNAQFQTGTNYVWSSFRGLASWDGGGTWNTDGIITKLTY